VGRPDAAGGEYVGVTDAQRIERLDNRILIVGDDADFPKVDADRRQVFGNVADVSVLGASGQDLVADHQDAGRDNLRRHVIFHRMFRLVADAVTTGFAATVQYQSGLS
jgi:hypothetical protein